MIHRHARRLAGITVAVEASPLETYWWTIPVLILSAVRAGLVEEVIVVTKRLVVTEEVHIRRIMSTEHVETSINLRKQHAVVERSDGEANLSFTQTIGEDQ